MKEERVKVCESRTLARKRKIRVRAWSGKGRFHREGRKIPRRASKKASLEQVEESMSG